MHWWLSTTYFQRLFYLSKPDSSKKMSMSKLYIDTSVMNWEQRQSFHCNAAYFTRVYRNQILIGWANLISLDPI